MVLSISTLTAVVGQAVENPAINWPIPIAPAGVNTATFPSARNEWMQKFAVNLQRAKTGDIDLLFQGDSITEDWKNVSSIWAKHFGKMKAATFGISGDRVENMLWRVQNGELEGLSPRLIVLLAGTNNLGKNTATEISEGIAGLVGEIERRCPKSHILLLGLFPRGNQASDAMRPKVKEVNDLLAARDWGSQITFQDIGAVFLKPDGSLPADVMPDFLHPNHAGYELWAQAIQPTITQYFPEATQ